MKKIILSTFFAFIALSSFSQKEVRANMRKGNNSFSEENYTEAEIAYRKALEANPNSQEASFNLGNSLYKQEKFEDAIQHFQQVANGSEDPLLQSKAYHNAGNVMMLGQDYARAIALYKESLKRNPNDHETRYNLALAQKLLQQQQQQQDQQDQDKDQDKQDQEQEQNQDQQNQDQQKDQKDQQDQNQDQKDQKDQEQEQNQNQQQQEGGSSDQISKDKASQILKALDQDEKKTQEKVKKQQMQQMQQKKTDKDW